MALRVKDVDATVEWYTTFTPLRVLNRNNDKFGRGVWLGHAEPSENPFVLVAAEFFPETDPFKDSPVASIGVFNHIGIELPTKDDVDAVAAQGETAGCLGMSARWMPDPVGYICMLTDPDGNWVEFSYDQGVYEKAREVWG